MKHIYITLFAFLIYCGLIFNACKKYDEGPAISFRAKKARLCDEWTIDKFFIDNNDNTEYMTNTWAEYKLTIEKKGNMSFITKTTTVNGEVNTTTTGTWEFIDHKNSIEFTETANIQNGVSAFSNTKREFEIIRLKEKEMCISETMKNGQQFKYYFKKIK